ncbi:L-type lectin-domain containing protein [Actinoplanes sp. NPDC051859]|uniref:L-type lectin-domain containing protein n=1 Tax=Actinoplanes sp. NPDC051859 TaxID=3363909 RepID=UPI0037BD2BBB
MRKRLATCAALTLAAALAGTSMTPAAVAAPSGSKKVISHSDFSAGPGLHMVGSTAVDGMALRLTSDTKRQAGAAWSKMKINPKWSFETWFDVSMTGAVGHADGVAFVLQNDGPMEIGGHGGSIGYGGMTHSVAVEMDTFKNPNDVDNNHVALVMHGASDETQSMVAPSPIQMFGQDIRVRITWNAKTKMLKVRVKAMGGDEMKILEEHVDLRKALGYKKAFVGFTGGTGEDVSVQKIKNWHLKVMH